MVATSSVWYCIFADCTVLYSSVVVCFVIHRSTVCKRYAQKGKVIKFSWDHFLLLNIVVYILYVPCLATNSFNNLIPGTELSR